MTRRPVLAWLSAVLIFLSHQAFFAQGIGAPAAVNEAMARAVLAKDSIHLQLPFATPASTAGRASVRLLSPTDTASQETAVDFRASARRVDLVLPWPKDDKGKPAGDVGWYRIAYRIETADRPSSNGILSIGAITPNLLTLRLALPETPLAGRPLSVRVYAGNPVTRTSFRGVHLEGTLEYDGQPEEDAKPLPRPVLREATTGLSGEAVLVYPIQGPPGESATLTVKGTFTGPDGAQATASVDADVRTFDRTAIRIDTDKPLHKPGEPVHLRALVIDDSGRAAANSPLTLTVNDPESKTLLEASLTTNRFGIASYDWKTGPQLAPGVYNATFKHDSDSSYPAQQSILIPIRRYDLPEFSVSASLDRGFYLDGQTPVVRIHAAYLFGKSLSAGPVRIVRDEPYRWNKPANQASEPEKVEQTASLDEQGDAELKLNLQDDFSDLRKADYQRYQDIQFRAYVTDATTGRTEPRNFTVRITRYPMHIYLNRVGGNDREGDYIVSTAYADGAPAACKVSLDWMDADSRPSPAASVTTNRYGLARVHLRYPSAPGDPDFQRFDLRLSARDPEHRTSLLDDTIDPGNPKNIWITVAQSLMKPGQNIEATVHAAPGSVVDVDAVSQQGVISHQLLHMVRAAEPLTVLMGDDFRGLVTLISYSIDESGDRNSYNPFRRGGYRTVLYPEDRALQLKLTGLRPSYAPGAMVDAAFDVRLADGFAAPSALGVSVFDTAVEQRSQTEEDAAQLSWSWWRDTSSVAGITYSALGKTNMSQPVSDDLQLLAEAGLGNYTPMKISIEHEDDWEARDQYNTLMRNSLKPVGEAVIAARPARLPGTVDAVRAIAVSAHLDTALLVDPWATPYRVRASVDWDDEVLNVTSAGPDKIFGTEDDFNIDATHRNLFALPGERLTALLREAFNAGQPLPGTVDALKQLTRARGLDLDATFDPGGKPFHYRISVGRRFYSVQVYRNDTSMQPDGRMDGPAIWASHSIDYFSPTESRMEAAIDAWSAAGHVFPANEAEARQAFAAAGIDFDALRDPLGQPFQLRVEQAMKFSHMEKVTAGAGLSEQDKPVTTLYRSIEVLRPVNLPEATDTVEPVAQFLRPMTQQSGSDARPVAVDQGVFKGNTGAIGGTIADPNRAVIQNATITATNTGNGITTTVKSLADGDYLVLGLEAGTYNVEVVATGFMPSLVTEVGVSPVALTTVDIVMKVGGASETVTVTDAPPFLNTSDATLGGSVRGFAQTPGAAGGKATISEPTFTPRLRHVFEETAYWAPSLETAANGRATLRFNLPDSLTTWKLHALASTVDGRIGYVDQTFRTFQPFFVDLDVPQVLTVGDQLSLPMNLRNYTGRSLALPVTVKPADWFNLLTPPKAQANVPANTSTPLIVGLRANSAIDAGPLRITAANEHEGDAVERTVLVHPDGEPLAVAAAGLLTQRTTSLTLDLPADALPGSIHAELRLYPNLGAHLLQAMKAVLQRPHGCAEQTISTAYPSLLYLELLKASHAENSAADPVAIEAQTYLQLGYDQLAGYFDASGGLTYWGGSDHTPDPALTAYAIEFLAEAAPYIVVDHAQLTAAINWLLTSQRADGTWKPRYGETSATLNLYVAGALAQAIAAEAFNNPQSKPLHDRVNKAVASATAWSATSAAAAHSPYANALRLRLANLTAADPATIAQLRAELAATAVHSKDGAHWNPSSYSPFYGWGRACAIETTALVLAALRQSAPSAADHALINDALFFLVRNQDRYGIWYSGQATVRVLQALLPLAIEQTKASPGPQAVQLAINGVPLAAADADALHVDPRLLSAPRSLDLTARLKPGHNELVFTAAEDASLASAEATAAFYVPWRSAPVSSNTQTGDEAGLDFAYACAATGAQAGKSVECTVDARRFGAPSYGMLLAEVGLPPGADVDRSSLARLLDSGTISRYELQPDRIVFYLWSPDAAGSHFSFRFTPRYAIHAKAAPAALTDFYNPDLKVVLAPQTFSIAGNGPR